MAGCETSARGCARASNRGLPTPSLPLQWRSSFIPGFRSAAGASACSSSSTIFCECTARALTLETSMSLAGLRQHEGASTRSPLISTMQARQLPSGRRPSL